LLAIAVTIIKLSILQNLGVLLHDTEASLNDSQGFMDLLDTAFQCGDIQQGCYEQQGRYQTRMLSENAGGAESSGWIAKPFARPANRVGMVL
jgi:hypothetical protein